MAYHLECDTCGYHHAPDDCPADWEQSSIFNEPCPFCARAPENVKAEYDSCPECGRSF